MENISVNNIYPDGLQFIFLENYSAKRVKSLINCINIRSAVVSKPHQ